MPSSLALGAQFRPDPQRSHIQWEMVFNKKEKVFGNVPIEAGSLEVGPLGISGRLSFEVGKIVSYEWEEADQTKKLSESRDERIHKILGAADKDKPAAEFVIKEVKGFSLEAGKSEVKVKGQLALNGTTRDVEIQGKIMMEKGDLRFEGTYRLPWKEYKIENPVMWFLRTLKTPAEEVEVSFSLYAVAPK